MCERSKEMASRIKSNTDLGWMPHVIFLTVTIALLFAAACVMVVLRSFPAPAVADISPQSHLRTTADALHAFQAAGLDYETLRLSKDERDVFSAYTAVTSVQFVIPAQGDSTRARGVIFSFQTESELQMVKEYYTRLGNMLPSYKSWLFVKGNLLLQINGEVPQAIAEQYGAALYPMDAW
jgi:hypothetical protein